MAAFLKNLARMLGGSSTAAPAVHLAAFGKHPGWNDHIDDLGLDTDDLITVKRLLYVQGINQNIDGGTWENAEPDRRLGAFGHNFLWHMRGDAASGEDQSLIAGRLWSSADGKGRDKYPMVVCVGMVDLPDSFAAQVAVPSLIKMHKQCAAATSAEQIRAIVDAEREALRKQVQMPPAPVPLSGALVAKVAGSHDLAPSREGFHRIVYQVVRGMSAYRPGAPGGGNGSRRPEQIRVPLCGLSPNDALFFWLRFCLTLLAPSTPLLLFVPDPAITRTEFAPNSTGWVDVLVGEPTPQNLFCIKGSTKALPLTSEIPYTLDRGFCRAVDGWVDACAALPAGAPLPAWPAL